MPKHCTPRRFLLTLLLGCVSACSDDPLGPLRDIPVGDTVSAACADAPVEIFRDEYGIPHIYAGSLNDAVCAQGYVMAQDRLVQMDLARRLASGTLAELLGGLDESLVDRDIAMRVHHMRATATQVWDALTASADPEDVRQVQVLQRFAAGVNAALDELKAGNRRLPGDLAILYDVSTTPAWTPVDSLVVARLQAFELSFDAATEITRTQVEQAAQQAFDQSPEPSRKARAGLWADLYRAAPLDPAFILPDATRCGASAWPGLPGGASASAPNALRSLIDRSGLSAALRVGLGVSEDRARGSNNWIVAPRHTRDGNAIVSNDTHLDLSNPPIFYLQHLVAGTGGDADADAIMGVQFPGLPGVVLGMNRRLAWGSTVTYADVTDVYQENIVDCGDGAPCVRFSATAGQPAQLLRLRARTEQIGVGRFGKISSQRSVTLWDVPHHGPILPRIVNHDAAPVAPGSTALSVRYTGHQPTNEVRAVLGLNRARTVAEAMAALERDFRVGGQNWVLADADGHIGWTSHVDLPVRAAGARPMYVMPGDGSAEWQDSVPAAQQPRAVDPSCGYLVTANNDPLGATGGATGTIYHGWEYEPGARAGRITRRLQTVLSAGGQLTPQAMQDIQADHESFLGGKLAPVLVDGGDALLKARTDPSSYPDVADLAAGLDDATLGLVQDATERVRSWGRSAASGLVNEVTAKEVDESIATSVFHVWLSGFTRRALDDELQVVAGLSQGALPPSTYRRKLVLVAALSPEQLRVGRTAAGDSLIFDDLGTAAVETRRRVAAQALIAGVKALSGALGADPTAWQWGKLHRLTLDPIVPVSSLALPGPRDARYPTGVPRHGDVFSVDVGSFGVGSDPVKPLEDFTYSSGAAIRFVAEVSPAGPKAFNVLPGGQVFDPDSPHYADLFGLYRVNLAIPLSFQPGDVAASVRKEQAAGNPAHARLVPRQ